MQLSPALALVAAFLASSAVEVLAAPQAGLGFAAGGRAAGAAIEKRVRKRQVEPECAAPKAESSQAGHASSIHKHHGHGHDGVKHHVAKQHSSGVHSIKHHHGSHHTGGKKTPGISVPVGTSLPPPGAGPEGYGPPSHSTGGSSAGEGKEPVQGAAAAPGSDGGVHCKGLLGSTTLPTNGRVKHEWFDPGLVHHGPGTQFGGATGFWEGGACMLDSLPHANLPSVAMDQTFFQDGLACGTCVEIAPASASLFSNSAQWSVEPPKRGTLPAGKKTVAIVSDLCPGVSQCWSGLDMHLDAWNSVTSGANGSKLPINWRFVNCKEAFHASGSGGSQLQVHWREGANPGFFQVQIRGSHEAVVAVEMKLHGAAWMRATHVDNSWWKWDGVAQTAATKPVVFRIVDWQGQTITTDQPTKIGTDVYVEANFDRVEPK